MTPSGIFFFLDLCLYSAIVCDITVEVLLQTWSGPEGSRKLRFSDFMTTARDGGRLSALRTGGLNPPPPMKYSWYSFLLEAESTPGP